MTVFISYSHSDKEFVDKLAAHLVKSNIPVWMDRWELKVGDSVTLKIQESLSESDYLLIVLSQQSIESDWFKREISTGLMREIEEKRAIILPVLIEDCKIPLLIRDKLYADFRQDFKSGLNSVINSLSAKYSQNQFSTSSEDYETDWGVEWHTNRLNNEFIVEIDSISYNKHKKYSVLFNLLITGNEVVLKRFDLFNKEGLDWFYKNVLLFTVADFINLEGLKILLENSFSKYLEGTFFDPKINLQLDYTIRCKWLGTDIGNNILFDFGNTLNMSIKHLKSIEPKFDSQTQEKINRLIKVPF